MIKFEQLKRAVVKEYSYIKRLQNPYKTILNYIRLVGYGKGEFNFGDESNTKFSVLIDGDSTALSCGATSYQNSLSYIIGNRIASKGLYVKLKNIGTKGAQVISLYLRKTQITQIYDLTILVIGSNDLLSLENPNVSNKSLKKVIEKYLTFSTRLIIMGPGRVDILRGIHDEDRELYRNEGIVFSELFEKTCSKFENIFYVNPQKEFNPIEKYGNTLNLQADDDFHPNDLGYSKYAMDLLDKGLKHFGL